MSSLLPLATAAVVAMAGLVGQVVVSRTALSSIRRQIDYPRWDAWRSMAVEAWADAAVLARRLDHDYLDLARMPDDQLTLLRTETVVAERALHGLSVATLSREVSEWAIELAVLFGQLSELLPNHSNCNDEEMRQEYQEVRHHLHALLPSRDGTSTSRVDRLHEAIRRRSEPPTVATGGVRPRALVLRRLRYYNRAL